MKHLFLIVMVVITFVTNYNAQEIRIEATPFHQTNIKAVSFSANEQHFASASDDQIIIWETQSGKSLKKIMTPRGSYTTIYDLLFCSLNQKEHLIVASSDGIQMYSFPGLTLEKTLMKGMPIKKVLPTKNGIILAHHKDIWRYSNEKFTKEYSGSSDLVSFAFWEEKNTLVALHEHTLLTNFNSKEFHEIAIPKIDELYEVHCKNGRAVLSGLNNTYYWNLTGEEMEVNKQTNATINFINRDEVVARKYQSNTVYILSNTGKVKDSLAASNTVIMKLQVSPSGKLGFGFGFKTMTIWYLPTKQLVREFTNNRTPLGTLAASNGQIIVAEKYNGKYRTFDFRRLGFENHNEDHTDKILSLQFANNSVFSASADGTFRFNSVSGNTQKSIINYGDPSQKIELSKRTDLVSKSNDIGKLLEYLSQAQLEVAEVSLDGSKIAFAVDRQLHILDINSRELIANEKAHADYIKDLKIDNKGNRIITSSLDRTVKIWDLKTGELIETLNGATDRVFGLALVKNGICATSGNGKLLCWNDKHELKQMSFGRNEAIKSICNYNNESVLIAQNNSILCVDVFNQSVSNSVNLKHAIKEIEKLSDSRFLVTDASNQIIIFDENLKTIATMILGTENSNSFFISTPDNYYTGDKESVLKQVSFTHNSFSFFDGRLDAIYNRPDIILERIGLAETRTINEYKKAYEKRRKRLSALSIDDLVNNAATVTFVNNSVLNKTDKKNYTFSVLASGVPTIKAFEVFVNGIEYSDFNQLWYKESKLANEVKQITIPLSQGKNVISVRPLSGDLKQGIANEMVVYYVPKKSSQPNLYIVSIGVSKYKDSNFNLAYAAKDSKDIQDFFKSSNSYYENVYTHNLTNENVNDDEIRAIRKFIKNIKIDDVFIITASGHGILDEDYNYYFADYDCDFSHPEGTAISYGFLSDILDKTVCRNRVLFLDACHAGEVDPESIREDIASVETIKTDVQFRASGNAYIAANNEGQNSFELQNQLFANLGNEKGSNVIAASAGVEFAIESDQWENGLFTYALINGLKDGSADLNQNGEIMLSELQTYLSQVVKSLSEGHQNPAFRASNHCQDIRIW